MCPRGCHLDALRQEGDADQAEALSISSTALVPAGSRIALTVAVANETAKVASLPRKWSRSPCPSSIVDGVVSGDAMQHVVRMLAAIRFALSTRRDLLLEMLALPHQLAVLARSNRRFRPSDRLLWLILRRVWPRWRDALVLVQPATVDRWHRDRFVRRWWRHSRRPGRPRIDSPCRDLIGRLAEENRLWGAPRIHGELLKLGVVVSERTVSRYLRERPKRPSQTWRTFIAHHLGQLECNTQVLSPYVSGDDLIDASPSTCRPISSDRLPASRQCALVR